MFDLDQQPQPTYCWQYCSQRQPSADCYGLLLDEGLKEEKKKCATAGKRGWAEWFKGHSCQRVLVQTPGTFYIICRSYRTTGSSQTLFSRTISASFIWLTTPPPKKKRFSGSQMSCTTKKSLPHTLQIPITKMLSQLNLWLVHMAV